MVSSGKLISVIVKISATLAKQFWRYLEFLIFEMPAIRHLGSWNFWSTVRLGGPICIAVPNFTKIGHTVAEISRYNDFQNGGHPPCRIFKSFIFQQLVCSVGLIGVIMQNVVKIGRTVSEISRFLYFQDGHHLPSWIFKKSICLTFLTVSVHNFVEIGLTVAEI